MNAEMTAPAFRLGRSDRQKYGLLDFLLQPILRAAEHITGLQQLQRLYDGLENYHGSFPDQALAALNISCDVSKRDLSNIPQQGPAVIVANHPFGGIEGIILMALLKKIRPDVKVMANYLLGRIPELQEFIIPVDPFAGKQAVRHNVAPMRETVNWVRQGGLLVVFPAGAVSSFDLRRGEVLDPDWSENLARVIRKSRAPVIPAYFPGHNSLLFLAAGLLHPALRTALLPQQLLNKRGKSIPLRIGQAIGVKRLQHFSDNRNLIDYLRWRTYFLALHDQCEETPREKTLRHDQPPVLTAMNPDRLHSELQQLPDSARLLQSGEFDVYIADAKQIPLTLREIGRLREETFRHAGEGTGKPLDLGTHDLYYLQLFIWQREKREIVGGYRIGATDRVLPVYGRRGLYVSTLFKLDPRLLERISPALELGRSFIRIDYQKSYAPLLLLWKGIGHYVARNPHYRYLFGPVSISREYKDTSRQLMASSLLQNYRFNRLEGLVEPMFPVKISPLNVGSGYDNGISRDIEEISELVAELELDNKGVPVLIRHYLNLGGKLLAFNLDPQFSDVIDGLLLVDLCATEEKLLQRYMGKDGAELFLSRHSESTGLKSGCAGALKTE